MHYQYDPFQQKAIDYINQGHSVIVSAPTGAGKTAIAEHVIETCLREGRKVVYTAPIKALSNQKYRDFAAQDESKVGIMTGDITLNADAPVLIMTTEIFRNKLLDESQDLKDFGWIIYDEIHYLDDLERGTVWEESLIFMPDHMNVLGLSATVPNVEQICSWLTSIHGKPVKIVREDKRPVPLEFFYQCQGRLYHDLKTLSSEGYRTVDGRRYHGHRVPRQSSLRPNPIQPLIETLKKDNRLPCVYFAFSRRRTEILANEISMMNFLSPKEKEEIAQLFDQLCERYDVLHDPGYSKIRPLVLNGIGFHHAGMLPTWKEVIEQLFTSRMLKVIFTTETFALGINMPARSVVFDELSKYDGRGFGQLRTRDFYQMAGRAGRRSIDHEGYVYCRVMPQYVSVKDVHRMVYSDPEPVKSQFNASYATILNLYRTYGEKLDVIYPKSFHYFQKRKYQHKRAVYLMKAKLDILKEMGYITDQQLTRKGVFAGHVYGYELILGELFEQNVLEYLSVERLGILILGIIYEPRRGTTKPELNDDIRELEQLTNKIVRGINRLEKYVDLPEKTKRCYFHLTPAMELWLQGKDFHEALNAVDADEGEVVRYFRMTIQVVREMLEGDLSPVLKERIRDLMGRINRDVIDSEKQLRA